MYDLVETKIQNMIYEIRGKQVMLDSEISITKCYNHFYDMTITHYDIDESISMFDDYVII